MLVAIVDRRKLFGSSIGAGDYGVGKTGEESKTVRYCSMQFLNGDGESSDESCLGRRNVR